MLICITLLIQIWSRIILDSRIRIGIIFGSQIRIRIKVKRGIRIHTLKWRKSESRFPAQHKWIEKSSMGDTDPVWYDPYVFGPPGSGSGWWKDPDPELDPDLYKYTTSWTLLQKVRSRKVNEENSRIRKQNRSINQRHGSADLDPLVRGTDSRIRIRTIPKCNGSAIKAKKTCYMYVCSVNCTVPWINIRTKNYRSRTDWRARKR